MKNLSVVLFFGLLLCSSEFSNDFTNDLSNTPYPNSFSFVNSSPIVITSDSNFTDYGFSGNGSLQNPYLIENFNITTSEAIGIYIFSTSKYFLVKKCYIDAAENGIVIDSVTNATAIIENNVCTGNVIRGIHILDSSGTRINNNSCSLNTFFGINIRNSSKCLITNNTCYSNGMAGIFVDQSSSNLISNNKCGLNIDGGIVVEDSPQSLVIGNSCKNNTRSGGISVSRSDNSTIVNNMCEYNIQENIGIRESNNTQIQYNLCIGNGFGIVSASGANITIDNNICTDTAVGVYLKDAENSIITNNALLNGGIKIVELNRQEYYSYFFQNNTINCNKFGFFAGVDNLEIVEPIYGQLILADCSNIQILNQNLSNTHIGISLFYCINGTLRNNFCSDNRDLGINICGTSGITLVNNTCDSNIAGVVLESSTKNELRYNTLKKNALWGVVLDLNSRNNAVHHNSFFNNNYIYGTSQAKDDGKNNLFYDLETEEGNYWDNYDNTGNYSIDGLANSYDLFPLVEPPIYAPPNYYGYLGFLSFIILIPLGIFGLKKYRKKK